MLKFFRTIRRRLLESGSLKKYLVYAIGEILLVVIGILIALQINNWNEDRKAKANEREYLKGIKRDLEQDLVFVQERIYQYSERLSMYSNLDTIFFTNLSDSNNPTVLSRKFDANQRIHYQDLFGRLRNFRLKVGTYHSLIYNGDSKIIQNQ